MSDVEQLQAAETRLLAEARRAAHASGRSPGNVALRQADKHTASEYSAVCRRCGRRDKGLQETLRHDPNYAMPVTT